MENKNILGILLIFGSMHSIYGIKFLQHFDAPSLSVTLRADSLMCLVTTKTTGAAGFGFAECADQTLSPQTPWCWGPKNLTPGQMKLWWGVSQKPSTYFSYGVSGTYVIPLAQLALPIGGIGLTPNSASIFDTYEFFDCPFLRYNEEDGDYTGVGHALEVWKNGKPMPVKKK